MESVIKTGYLEYLARGIGSKETWQKRFYVLRATNKTQEGRLDWFPDEGSFKTNTAIGKTLYLQHIKDIGICKLQDRMHTMEICDKTTDKPHMYSFDTKTVMKEWMDSIKEAKEKNLKTERVLPKIALPQKDQEEMLYDENSVYEASDPDLVYTVEMSESEAATRLELSGVYTMLVSKVFITLSKPNTGENVISWCYRNIRRYGRSKNSFTLEAGRKCNSGEGLFTFRVVDGHNLFAAVQERTRQMSRQSLDTPTPTDTPSLPSKGVNTLPANMGPGGNYVGLSKAPLTATVSIGAERNKNRELPKIPIKPSSPAIAPKPKSPNAAGKVHPNLMKEIKQKENEKMSCIDNAKSNAPKVDFSTHPLLVSGSKAKPTPVPVQPPVTVPTEEENIYDEAYMEVEAQTKPPDPAVNNPTKIENMYHLYDPSRNSKPLPSQASDSDLYAYADPPLHAGMDDVDGDVYANDDDDYASCAASTPMSADGKSPMSSIVAMLNSTKLENKIKRKSASQYDEVNLHKSLVERASSVGHLDENQYSSVSLDNQKV